MKLLTHNFLTSKCIKGVATGYPLKISAKETRVAEVEFNHEFIARMIPKLEWSAVCEAAESLGIADMPKEVVPDYESNEDFLKKAHHILMEVEVINGDLICPETQRRFPVTDGIPNMLVNEDEV